MASTWSSCRPWGNAAISVRRSSWSPCSHIAGLLGAAPPFNGGKALAATPQHWHLPAGSEEAAQDDIAEWIEFSTTPAVRNALLGGRSGSYLNRPGASITISPRSMRQADDLGDQPDRLLTVGCHA
ncbi:hypothetical protein, partial [Novosphingobium sp.]|uniref:hypothetical protein n=1 Tax=Novosphingobium sp. TaxID=1874826 RepID=UPI001ECFC8C7